MIDENFNRDFRIDELIKKREVFSNDVSKIKRYKFEVKEILKDRRNDQTTITNMTDEILNRDYRIYHINKNKETYSNDVFKIEIYRFNSKEI